MGEAELIGALKQGGPWAVVVGVMYVLHRRDSNAYLTMLVGVVEKNTAAITSLIEMLDRVLEGRDRN